MLVLSLLVLAQCWLLISIDCKLITLDHRMRDLEVKDV